MRVLMRETRTQEDVTGSRLFLGGQTYEISDVIAQQWIHLGIAALVVEDKAFRGAPENKAGRRGR